MTARTPHAAPTVALAPVFVALWSSGYVVGDLAIRVCGPVPLLTARFALASLVTVPLALRHGRWRGAPLHRLVALGLLLQVVQFGGIYGGFALGVPAGISALVMLGLSPLVTTGLAIAGGQERGDRRLWVGLAIGVLGVAVGLAPDVSGAHVGAGIALTAAGMLGLAGGTVLQRRWSAAADPRVSAAAQSLTGTIVMAPVAVLAGGRLTPGPELVLSVAWLAWGMGVVTLLVLMTLLSRMEASRVGALLLLVPAVTALASAPTLGEAVHPLTLVGMAIAMVGVGMVLRREAAGADTAHRGHGTDPIEVAVH